MSGPVRLDDVRMSPFLRRITIFSSGGPFLEGYVLGIIGVALVKMTPELGIDEHWTGLIGVASIIGLFVGASFGGLLTDHIGRRKMFVLDLITIIVLSIACSIVQEPWQLFVLRLIIGATIGADYPIATSMIAEFTPRRYRAISMGFIAAVWYVGANVAYLVGYFLLDAPNGWRWMLASSVVPCVIILLGRMSIPESPRWLYSKGRTEEANRIVRHVYGADVVLDDETVEKTKIAKIFQWVYFRRILFVGVIWLCQAIPMFAIYTYGPRIIGAFGLGEGKAALIGELVIGTFFMLGTIPAMFLAESWGRRPLVIWTFVIMTAALAVLGVVPDATLWVVIACFAIYALASGGPGNLQWLYPNELFPTDVRATAMGLAMAVSRIGTVITTYVLPDYLASHGIGSTMLVGAAISALGLVVSVAWAPETKGLPLSETGRPDFTGR
ncbi:MAG: MFS transporter [Actinomyces sp.]|uniref:MFS transporter n=1 Tax=Schaalia naturae TaxID=635203 RepID=A0ABW2SIZ8_9ACTO|nr:MFS transporter [Actinomyces sp.]MCI1691666.1 MFS transporter [Actinomyces sp.]MCI1788008.1 MFS transporter [Actinomyces sp.]MCI1830557.1 MFS transporter [Actinomyces sp.]